MEPARGGELMVLAEGEEECPCGEGIRGGNRGLRDQPGFSASPANGHFCVQTSQGDPMGLLS